MIQYSTTLRNAMLSGDGLAHQMTNVAAGAGAGTGAMFLYLFNGTVPTGPEAALNMATTHTKLGKISSNAGGATGCALAAASGGVIQKNSSETWSTGAMSFSGVNSASPTLAATFFRIVEGTDDPTAASTTTPRIQGTCGTDMSYDMDLGASAVLTAGNSLTLNSFQIQDPNF